MRILALVVLLCSGCQKPPTPVVDDTSLRKPTATDIFNLRTKCAELGRKIMENNIIGVALTQDQVSHYDPKTNRCYVELTVQTADLTKAGNYFQQYLFDGQTGEMLAWVRNQEGDQFGMVYDGRHTSPSPVPYNAKVLYADANTYIDERMADDRKQ